MIGNFKEIDALMSGSCSSPLTFSHGVSFLLGEAERLRQIYLSIYLSLDPFGNCVGYEDSL